jgi:glyoxylate utilization-related uncharacterized protein
MDFNRRTVTLPAGSERAYDESEWVDALVIVVEGVIEVECSSGCRRRFPRGAILWLTDLQVRALHNPGAESARLCAISRRPMNS